MEPLFATSQTEALVPRIREFILTELVPLETTEYLTGNFSTVARVLDQKRELVRKAGLWGLQHSVDEGGLGLSLCEFGQVSEVLAWSPFGHYTFNCQAPDIGNMELLHRHASDTLRRHYLEPLRDGHIRSCFSMTEPEFAGSNPTRLGTTAERDGDNWVINGHKWFTSSADGAAFAIVMAVTNPAAAPHRRASMLLVPTDTPGFELVRNISIMGEPSDHWGSHAEIRYTDVRVPLGNLIGDEGVGFTLAQERLGPGRIHHCMRWIGISERCLDLMCRRAATRELEDGVMLGEKQFVQGWIAESRAQIDAARLMVLRTAHNIDQRGAAAVRDQISAIKFFVADVMLTVIDRAIQTYGAMGITDDIVLPWYYRHERGARIYDGADEVHKTALARSLLKGYGLDTRKPKPINNRHDA
jgi:alkylation response protein AidB-like acyl-CoA dehydrogenase